MRQGWRLRVDGPVSEALIPVVDKIQWMMLRRDVSLCYVPVEAEHRIPEPEAGARTVLAFSGGVDSFFTLLQAGHLVDDLLLVHGADIGMDQQEAYDRVEVRLNEVAGALGKGFLTASTNLRQFSSRYTDWAAHQFGSTLVGVGRLFVPEARRLVLSGEQGVDVPHASSEELDPLWSTPGFEVREFGSRITRLQKLGVIGLDPAVQKHLRVCWEHVAAYNCGRCSKCLRNMAALDVWGYLSLFSSFPQGPYLKSLRRLRLSGGLPHLREGAEEMLEMAESRRCRTELTAALRRLVLRAHDRDWRARVRKLLDLGRGLKGPDARRRESTVNRNDLSGDIAGA
jgi:hypothetical protein